MRPLAVYKRIPLSFSFINITGVQFEKEWAKLKDRNSGVAVSWSVEGEVLTVHCLNQGRLHDLETAAAINRAFQARGERSSEAGSYYGRGSL